jgi:RHS repeat-associated protein
LVTFQSNDQSEDQQKQAAPSISLPKGGGAIRGIGEKFAANPVTGTGSMTVPIAVSPGRSGFGPQLSLSYDSGSGNGPFGFGWSLSLPSITRKTDKGLPRYLDGQDQVPDTDVFILSASEDLVPELAKDDQGNWIINDGRLVIHDKPRIVGSATYRIRRYRPRIEGLFARIERWTNEANPEDCFWRSISKDNITTWYGKSKESRIADPADQSRIYNWLICESHDDKGNVIVYGYKSENSERIFEDEDGNAITLANERNRERTANRYLKRIRYGNHKPYLPKLLADQPWPAPPRASDPEGSKDWFFEVVFDYSEHDASVPNPNDDSARSNSKPWPARTDPFSIYRSGFEIRTYRLCQRVLMFHQFEGEGGVGKDCLVCSTDFTYSHEIDSDHARNPVYTFLLAVTQTGYRREGNGYLKRSLPPVEFEYTQPLVQDTVEEVDPENLENLPIGLDGTIYQWTDLHGEGVPGILTEQAGAWFYKRNLSPINVKPGSGAGHVEAKFAPVELVAVKPKLALAGGAQFMDLAGDGQPDLVVLDGPMAGLHEHDGDEGWQPFRPFTSRLSRDTRDPNLRFVDLDGDGHADVLITEDDAFVWHPSLEEVGFGPARRVAQALDEEKGPRLVFADGEQSIYLADLSGDGLTDLARIRNGEVCYWPNLGYGRFGAKVTMDHAPWFDNPDQFDQRRIRLADIDGTGTVDIIYLHRDGVQLYFNQSGNSWSEPHLLRIFPRVDEIVSITPTDLLGNGTACLVWSSPLPGDAARQMRYVNLMGGQKPHLLVKTVNNLGAETRVHYAPSTKFYLQDKAAGEPWLTRLPFPVHVVERVETYDHISRNRFVTRYAYHHGYFDGEEREFRGFGMVEQFDTEEFAALSASDDFPTGDNIDAASHVPPVHTKTWFHTGVYLDREHISRQYEDEYYREPGLKDQEFQALLLPDTHLPTGLTLEEEREACRALKGMMLRQEVYADDAPPGASEALIQRAGTPYTVAEQDFTIRVLQPRAGNHHAVFFTHPREAITYHYERNPADPRIQHALTLEVDDFGNVLKEAAIAYGRRQPDLTLSPEDQAKQTQTLVVYTENRVTNAIAFDDDYLTPLPCETRTFELTGYTPTGAAGRFQFADLVQPGLRPNRLAHIFDSEVLYEVEAGSGRQRRLIEHVRSLYRPDDLGNAENNPLTLLPLGTLEPLALPGESYQLAFTPGLLAQVYQRPFDTIQPPGAPPPDNLLPNPANVLGGQGADGGGYIDLADDGHWWIPTGRVFFSPESDVAPVQELAFARRHFFLPYRFREPFHTDEVSTESFVVYDEYDLLMLDTRDPLDNRVTVGERDVDGNLTMPGNDYRTLQPRLVMDPNRNRTEVAFDTLGMVVGTAVMGKPEETLGDSLDGFSADLTENEILDHLDNPLSDPHAILGRATTRLVYDLFAYQRTKDQAKPQPAAVYTLARETHDADLEPDQQTKIQHRFSYSDGFGREIQQKIKAEPGPGPKRDADGKIIVGPDGQPEMTGDDVSLRWVGSGWTVFNNKEKPVRQYEPFFTDTHRFEFDVRIGVSPVLFYDPVARVVATLHPNHTWEKVVFDPWRQESWDVNDTVLVADPRTDPDVGDFFRRLPEADYLPTWYEHRQSGEFGRQEQAAARKAAVHANTPAIAHADALGRPCLTISNNRFKFRNTPPSEPPTEEFYETRVVYDIEGNEREVFDAKQRVVMRYHYDMLGNRIHYASMEAGERWMFNDVAGNPIRAWDSRDHEFRTAYDPLRRPVGSYMSEGAGDKLLVGSTLYGETLPNPETNNLRGQVVQVLDQAGVVTSDEYDFKGNLLHSQRQLAREYKTTLDWSADVPLETDTFTSRTAYDALNRATELTAPDDSVIRPTYNKANLLERIEVNLRGEAAATPFVTDLDYDAKGQRVLAEFGNGIRTTYEYDPLTFRLVHLQTMRDTEALQDLRYTYDPAGNITHIRDEAQQTIFFRNRCVESSNNYTYDAIYRLIEATGREHLEQFGGAPIPHSHDDALPVGLLHPGDGNALGAYVERYIYDAVGSFLRMQHRGSDPSHPGWKRTYEYNEGSLLEPAVQSNRLSATMIGSGPSETYTYDIHGNMTTMPHLPLMRWDFRDQLQATAQQVINNGTPETTYYVYDAGGQRVRKVTERQAAPDETSSRKQERIYLGGFEIYREYENDGETITLERDTLHIMDDQQRIALVETRTHGSDPAPEQLIRYHFGNHLGSASLELDDRAQIVSYEEYTPYGSTSYQAVRSQTETPKRYRYTGKERDEESGLYYHGVRYYAPWIGKWTGTDPAGIIDGTNLYVYGRNNPVMNADSTGAYCDPTMQSCIDPTVPTEREQELQQCLPEDERYPPSSSSSPSSARSHPTPVAPQSELGPRGEYIPTADWGGGPLRPVDAYTKPYARMHAAQGNYEAAELAENYLCATCHVLTKVDPSEFSLRGYVRSYQRGYVQGFIEIPLMANPVGAAWGIGVSGGQAITGESSGLHISNISSVLVDNHWDIGRQLSTEERLWEAGTFAVGAATLGWGAYAQARPLPGTGAFSEGASGGGGLGRLAGAEIRVSERGMQIVERHLTKFGSHPENTAMINRLRSALAEGRTISGADASFYMHEVNEATRMARLTAGGARTFEEAYDIAHAAALQKYGVSPFSVYHPEVIAIMPERFNQNWFLFWGIQR